MRTKSENTKLMIENFMSLLGEGYSVAEIAQKYNLSKQTVYFHLQEIADYKGISRDTLRSIIKSGKNQKKVNEQEQKVRLNVKNLKDGFSNANFKTGKIIESINKFLEGIKDDDG